MAVVLSEESIVIQKKFDAAVNIIQNLPKEGPFQQSNEMKLQFYGLYKQATVGPCNISKPGFWDVVSKAKWEAWSNLKDMSPDVAKNKYVTLLAGIVETMQLNSGVQHFIDLIGPVYDLVCKNENNNDAHHSDDSGVHLMKTQERDERSGFTSEDDNYADARDVVREEGEVTSPASPPQTTSSLSGDEFTHVHTKTVQWKKTSRKDDSAGKVVGKLLREIPLVERNSAQGNVACGNNSQDYDQLLSDAWEAAERAEADRQSRHYNSDHSDTLVMSRRRKTPMKRGRGRGDQPKSSKPPGKDEQPSSSEQTGSHNPQNTDEGSDRSCVVVGREGSGGSSEESSGSRDSPQLIWDPQVAAVLYRMHKDVQQLRRQMDLVEGVLLTQQRMVTATLNNTIEAERSRGSFFTSLPVRTVAFIVVWPFLVNIIIRLCWRAFLTRRRRL